MSTAPVMITPAPRSEPESYARPQPRRHLRLVPAPQLSIDDVMFQRALPQSEESFARVPTRQSDLPEADALINGFFVAVTEALVGRRTVDQLSANATLPVMKWLRRMAPGPGAQAAPRPAIRRIHVCRVRDGVQEATAIVQHGPHVRAMNARFVGLDGRWQCVQLELV